MTLDCVYQGKHCNAVAIKLIPGSVGSTMCPSAEAALQDQRLPGWPAEEGLASSENRKKTSVLKHSVEGKYKGRKTMERSQDSECYLKALTRDVTYFCKIILVANLLFL